MPLATGCNHIALVTEDLDRFLVFWTEVFDADVLLDMREGPMRHAMVDLGGGFCLHPFEFDQGNPHGDASPEMFDRGHLDHVAIGVEDPDAFALLRQRLVDAGASDGTLTDFGPVRTVWFEDPDGMGCEIAHWADGPPVTLADAGREPLDYSSDRARDGATRGGSLGILG